MNVVGGARGAGIVLSILLLCGGLLASGTASADSTFDWPLRPRPSVERTFDKPERNWLPGHRGVDLAGEENQSVLATGAGIVAFAGVVAGKPTVSVDHPGGLRTTYEPVVAQVHAGDRVSTGAVIGLLQAGHEGCDRPACLHWGLRRGREYLDPLGMIHSRPLRLKPLGPR